MASSCDLKNWKLEVNSDQLHAVGMNGSMRIKTSPIVKIEDDIVETAIGAKFRLSKQDKNPNHWDVAFQITHPHHAAKVMHLLR